MNNNLKALSVLAVTGGLMFSTTQSAEAANWSWSQNKPAVVNYWASADFVPPAGNVWIGGFAHRPAGASDSNYAVQFYVQLVKTSGSSKVFSSYSWPVDNVTRYDGRTAVVANGGTSYYIRLYGQNVAQRNGYLMDNSGVRARNY